MVLVQLSSLALLAALLCASNVMAFSVTKSRSVTPPTIAKSQTVALHMAEDDNKEGGEKTFVSSVFKKELAFDEKTGRFFETGFGAGECVPDEEYCMTDKNTGEMIRLTIEEKERIFLDALQVSLCCKEKLRVACEFQTLSKRKIRQSDFLLCSFYSLYFAVLFADRHTTPAAERCSVILNSIY